MVAKNLMAWLLSVSICLLIGCGQRNKTPNLAPEDTITLAGTVLCPDGKPIQADVQVMSDFRGEAKFVRTVSDDNGRFELKFQLADIQQRIDGADWKYGVLTANADGYGPAGIALAALRPGASNIKLRLSKDIAIRGVITDGEGRSISRANISVVSIHDCRRGVDAYLKHLNSGASEDELLDFIHTHATRIPARRVLSDDKNALSYSTDENGSFEIRGVGADRVAWLYVKGDGIVSDHIQVVTREQIGGKAVRSKGPAAYSAQVAYQGVAAKPIFGRVVDRDTGSGIPDAKINGRTITGTDGKFQLTGIAQEGAATIRVSSPAESPYVGTHLTIVDGNDGEPLEVELARGVIVRGQVVHEDSGAPVRAEVTYRPDADYHIYPPLIQTAQDGKFSLAALTDPGTLSIRLVDGEYVSPAPVQLNPKSLDDHQELVIRVGLGFEVKGQLSKLGNIDTESVEVVGLTGDLVKRKLNDDGRFQVVGLEKGIDRTVVFRERKQNLATAVIVNHDTEQPLQLTLETCARTVGRLVDESGKPMIKETIALLPEGSHARINELTGRSLPPMLGLYTTDENGRFEISDVVPGVGVEIIAGSNPSKAKLVTSILLEPGEMLELGDVTPRQ